MTVFSFRKITQRPGQILDFTFYSVSPPPENQENSVLEKESSPAWSFDEHNESSVLRILRNFLYNESVLSSIANQRDPLRRKNLKWWFIVKFIVKVSVFLWIGIRVQFLDCQDTPNTQLNASSMQARSTRADSANRKNIIVGNLSLKNCRVRKTDSLPNSGWSQILVNNFSFFLFRGWWYILMSPPMSILDVGACRRCNIFTCHMGGLPDP